jgi:hypothetical protein
VAKGPRAIKKVAISIKVDTLSLSSEELRKLGQKITRGGHKSKVFFCRRMVILWDISVKAGETDKVVSKVTRPNKRSGIRQTYVCNLGFS